MTEDYVNLVGDLMYPKGEVASTIKIENGMVCQYFNDYLGHIKLVSTSTN